MLRSMFSAVSGLRAHQTMMDVTGNNIANVNTTGFKSSRTTFQETLNQVVRGGTAGLAGADGAGGVNPMQLGLGSQVGGTDVVFGQGASQTTGRATDVAIQGEGFFEVQTAEGSFYTRAGAFSFDNAGQLVGPGGERVMGYNAVDADGEPVGGPDAIQIELNDYTEISIGADGVVRGRNEDNEIVPVARLRMATFANPEGLTKAGNGLFADTAASGDPVFGLAGDDGFGTLQSGTLEMSNVDLAQEFTNLILSQRGFQANARSITTSDELLQELVNLKR
jgi:flagellar hook protein FlgE